MMRLKLNKAKIIDIVFLKVNPTYKHRICKYTIELFERTTLEQRMQLNKMDVLTRVMWSPLEMKKIIQEIEDIKIISVFKKSEKTLMSVKAL